MPLSKRVAMWRRGYRPVSYTLYDLSPARAGEYLPDKARLQTLYSSRAASTFFINGPFARTVLDDKLLFTTLLSPQLPIPSILALIEKGETFVREHTHKHDVLSLAEAHGSVILKPSDGSRGRGIHRPDLEPTPILNGRAVTPEQVRELTKKLDNYLVTEAVQQAPYAETICPVTTNTLRVMTFVDPDTHEPFIARAVHRFGSHETRPTDNWSRGGTARTSSSRRVRWGRASNTPKGRGSFSGTATIPIRARPSKGCAFRVGKRCAARF